MRRPLSIILALLLTAAAAGALLTACGGNDGFNTDGSPRLSQPDFVRTPPPVKLPGYGSGEQQQREEQRDQGLYSGLIDLSGLSQGYVAARLTAPVKAKLRVQKGDETLGELDYYPLANDGSYNFFPLTRGNGHYTFILHVFSEDTPRGPLFERFIVVEAEVVLESEFAPFLVPSVEVNYNAESDCVALSHEITKHCASNLEVVQQVYAWIADNIGYDTDKAISLRGSTDGYLPSPDDTLRTRNGICYDYAALAAAMLRANAIPTQLIKGDVSDGKGGTVYHAWNMVWLEETGWIAVGLATNPGDWARIDTTFAASDAVGIASFIGDGSNYIPFSVH